MDIIKLINSYDPNWSSTPKTEKNRGFQEIFDQKLETEAPTPMSTLSQSKADVLNLGDKVLDLLDLYAQELMDPSKTLKDIAPIVENIEKEIGEIEARTNETVKADKDLNQLVGDLMVTANTAVFKFHRGDYI
jgi:hypothetical protein